MAGMPEQRFPFRPWVRSTCRRAILWGIGVVAALGLLTWWLHEPGGAPLARAFGVLVLYAALFLLTLAKIWWTAGGAAVVMDGDSIGYQPLHTFRPRRIRFDRIVACEPRPGTQSLRLVHDAGRGVARELFLNLAVVAGRNELLLALGERLVAAGLEPVRGARDSWRRSDADAALAP